MWLWALKDISIIVILALIGVLSLFKLGAFAPLIATALYVFITIRFGDFTVLEFIKHGIVFCIAGQQNIFGGVSMSLFDLLKSKGTSTRQLMGVESIGENYLKTKHGNLFLYNIQPTNVSVLSNDALRIKNQCPCDCPARTL